MKLIDTHAHIYASQFDDDRDEVVERARKEGIEQIYLPNIDQQSIESMLELEAAYPGRCFAMMGLHPCSVKDNYKEELKIVEKWLEKRPFCAVGEIGIDLYWDKAHVDEQKEAFIQQINWAKDLGKPIVIHSREATDMIIEIVKEHKDERLQGIFHCFTGTLEQARAIMDLEFFMGIGGVVTFKKSTLPEILKEVPLDYLVMETDAPYLAPSPFRGKRNESAYIRHIAKKLAEIKEIEIKALAKATTTNAMKIFQPQGITI